MLTLTAEASTYGYLYPFIPFMVRSFGGDIKVSSMLLFLPFLPRSLLKPYPSRSPPPSQREAKKRTVMVAIRPEVMPLFAGGGRRFPLRMVGILSCCCPVTFTVSVLPERQDPILSKPSCFACPQAIAARSSLFDRSPPSHHMPPHSTLADACQGPQFTALSIP